MLHGKRLRKKGRGIESEMERMRVKLQGKRKIRVWDKLKNFHFFQKGQQNVEVLS